MHISTEPNSQTVLTKLARYSHHHDHLKSLEQEYRFMREQQTYARMTDPTFRTDAAGMAQNDSHTWLRTSLIISLSSSTAPSFWAKVDQAYQAVRALIHQFYPAATVDIYFDSAHITVKTLAEDQPQTQADLAQYRVIIQPIVEQWLSSMAAATQLYAVGLFSSLTKDKGLSLGVRFYPTLPLIQIIRGEVGVALYQAKPAPALRPEHKFHTALTHCTGLRARLVDFPLSDRFRTAFQHVVESHDTTVFGTVADLRAADFCIRHGYSDQLVPLAEVTCGP